MVHNTEDRGSYVNPYAAAALAWCDILQETLENVKDMIYDGLYNERLIEELRDAAEQVDTAAAWLPTVKMEGV